VWGSERYLASQGMYVLVANCCHIANFEDLKFKHMNKKQDQVAVNISATFIRCSGQGNRTLILLDEPASSGAGAKDTLEAVFKSSV
jgi:spore coat protein U-like protein